MFFHFVHNGDYIYKLSKIYNVNENKIIKDNSLIEPAKLVINQCLLIDNGEQNNNKEEKIFNGYCYEYSNVENVKKTLPYLTFLSIFCYKVKEDGSLDLINDNKWIDLAYENNVKPIMVITNAKNKGGFSPSLAHEIISNNQNINNLFINIDKILKEKRYYGLNIDFEYVKQEDKDLFIEFIKKANQFFKEKGYYLSISLAPKNSDNQKGLLYTAHDYESLSKYVDHVILMTYEWGYTYGPSMPVSPYNLVKEVLEYAKSKMDNKKIIMGIPNYGYDFIIPYKEKQKANSITNPKAIPLAYNNHVEIKRYKQARTPYFNYIKDNIKHEVQFDDPSSIEDKLSLIDDLNIAGGSIWTISNYTAYYYLLINNGFKIKKY